MARITVETIYELLMENTKNRYKNISQFIRMQKMEQADDILCYIVIIKINGFNLYVKTNFKHSKSYIAVILFNSSCQTYVAVK